MRWSFLAMISGVACLAAGLSCGAAQPLDESKIVDLTYPFGSATVYWPTERGFQFEHIHRGQTAGGYYYAANRFCAAEHGGTHVDAPAHFSATGKPADKLPLAALIGPAVVVDVSAQAGRDRDYRLRVEDLRVWEQKNGRIPDGAIVLMYSGWGRYWPDRGKYLGTARPGDTRNLHFPGFSSEAVEWLLRERDIDAIGVDTASVDHGPSTDFRVHRILSAANKPALENVANLERLPPIGATLVALPMKIEGGSGAPARIVAILP